MINFIIRYSTLRYRILLGFLFVCLLIFLSSWLNYYNSKANLRNLELLNNETSIEQQFVAIKQDVLLLHNTVQRYTFSGYESALNQINQLDKNIGLKIEFLLPKIKNKEIREKIDRITSALNRYKKTLEKVVKERKLSSEQRERSLHDDHDRLVDWLKKLNTILKKEMIETDSHVLKNTLNDFLLVELDISNYFAHLDTPSLDQALIRIDHILDNLKREHKKSSNLQFSKILTDGWNMFSIYRNSLIRSVQTTRGYLFLVNVVLAGEASELIFITQSLIDELIKLTETRKKAIYKDTKESQATIFTMSFLILFIGIFLSIIISQSISRPISSITKAFNDLIKGQPIAKVPGRHLKDELGDLARSAEMFKQKSEENQKLLLATQKMTKELESKRKELSRSNDELEQFVYTVSHDLKSPLVTSSGFINVIESLFRQGEFQKGVSKFNFIKEANERMSLLITDLLELSRVGRLDLEKENVDLNSFFEEFTKIHHSRLKSKDMELIIPSNSPTLWANYSRLLQVFENLLSNSIKYRRKEIACKVWIRVKKEKDKVSFEFEDNGIGINERYYKKIFNLFYRIDNTTNGTGIGLAIIKKIVSNHGGEIRVKSTEGEGTQFQFSISNSQL